MFETETPRRLQAIQAELDRAADEYMFAKDAYEEARVQFEAARDKFASVRNLATQMLTTYDYSNWELQHQQVRYAVMGIGDAITSVLRSHAFSSAFRHVHTPDQYPYAPFLSLEQIADALERGGFEFRTTATGREINAALINLASVQKDRSGKYALAGAEEVLEMAKNLKEEGHLLEQE
jgi:hypothetical protein